MTSHSISDSGDGSTPDETEVWPRFAVDFTYQGKTYALDLYAPDATHAEAMVDAIKETAQYKGKFNT